ncbi:MAG: hypothetical protein MUC56_14250 [Thermoanaerobaculales bacterium]|jgi:hypothetical protein|nr:hypothetical protein [Thermoanaerobaculales bacterium]
MSIRPWLSGLALVGASLLHPVTAQAGELGFQAFDESFNGVSPAAPFLAVGPGNIVAVSHDGIRFFTKDGAMTYDNTFSGTGGFFPGGGTPRNPRVLFDPHTDRFVVAGYYSYGVHDFITVAVSDDADPNGEWYRHTIPVDAVGSIPLFYGDRTTLGVDESAIYVYNDFYFAGNPADPFSHGFVFSIDKLALAGGGTPDVVAVEPFEDPLATVPAVTYDAGAPAEYLVTPFGTYGDEDKIRLFALRDALSTPVVDTLELEVPPYDFLSESDRMPHPGGGVTLSATDSRMRHAVYRAGSLWTAHHVRDPASGRHLARWYEIRMNGWPVSGELPALAQTGEIELGADIHTFLPEIVPDGAGNAVISFHHTSATSPPAFAAAVRLAGDPPGQTRFVATLRETEVQLGSPTVYSSSTTADIDPTDPARGWVGGVYWITNQWNGRQPAMWVNSVALLDTAALFADGFESGDAGAWSASAP